MRWTASQILPHCLAAVLALSLAGCATTATPTLEARAAPLLVQDKSPLRLALLMTEEEREKTHELTAEIQMLFHTFHFKLTPGHTLLDTLVLSLSPAFERVTAVRAPPAPGAFHLVLVPKIVEVQVSHQVIPFQPADLTFTVKATLTVLDQSGKELVVLRAQGADTGRLMMGDMDARELSGRSVSLAIRNLVKKWGEQLVGSPEIQQYAAQLRPGLAAGVGARPTAPDIAISFSYPPEAARVSDESIGVVGVVSAPKGVRRLELLVNGRSVPVSWDIRAQAAEAQNQPFSAQAPLRPGENVIVLIAFDTAGGTAQALRTVYHEAAQPVGPSPAGKPLSLGERWAVVIGIDHYKDPSIAPLRYATADAEAVLRFLTTKGGVKPANARLLLNRDATQRNIRQILGDFLRQKVLRDDEVIIYYAGHGTTEADASAEGGLAKYLVPWDADPSSLFSTAIPMEEIERIFGRLATRKLLMVQDTCFSGAAGGRTFLTKGLTMRAGTLTDKFLQELSQKEGRMVLTASDINQVSQEDSALGHGIFTYFFLDAVAGAADLDGDGAVTVREVHLFLQRKVHERSGGTQTPQLYAIGDMVLIRK